MIATRVSLPYRADRAFLTACGVNSIRTAEENAKAKWADLSPPISAARLFGSLAQTVTPRAHERTSMRGVAQARQPLRARRM